MSKVLKNTIKHLRSEHSEMTQKALADAVNVSRQTVVAIEKGKYSPSLEVAFKIADVFNVALTDVFQYEADD